MKKGFTQKVIVNVLLIHMVTLGLGAGVVRAESPAPPVPPPALAPEAPAPAVAAADKAVSKGAANSLDNAIMDFFKNIGKVQLGEVVKSKVALVAGGVVIAGGLAWAFKDKIYYLFERGDAQQTDNSSKDFQVPDSVKSHASLESVNLNQIRSAKY